MPPQEKTPFLTEVKGEVDEVFAGVFDELSDICTDDDKLTEALKNLNKGVWAVVEKRTKESYFNGKKAAGGNGTPSRKEAAPKRSNPFRRS